MIEMRALQDDRVGPMLICDHCGEPITDMGYAMVKYELELHGKTSGTAGPYQMLHKGECDTATGPVGQEYGWKELTHFMIQALVNAMRPEDRADEKSAIDYLNRQVRSTFEWNEL